METDGDIVMHVDKYIGPMVFGPEELICALHVQMVHVWRGVSPCDYMVSEAWWQSDGLILPEA